MLQLLLLLCPLLLCILAPGLGHCRHLLVLLRGCLAAAGAGSCSLRRARHCIVCLLLQFLLLVLLLRLWSLLLWLLLLLLLLLLRLLLSGLRAIISCRQRQAAVATGSRTLTV